MVPSLNARTGSLALIALGFATLALAGLMLLFTESSLVFVSLLGFLLVLIGSAMRQRTRAARPKTSTTSGETAPRDSL
jgi:membrane protein implicated in regulation of membrane protease activity